MASEAGTPRAKTLTNERSVMKVSSQSSAGDLSLIDLLRAKTLVNETPATSKTNATRN